MTFSPEPDMNATCCAQTIPLHRPWRVRIADAWQAWRAERRRRECEAAVYRELGGLSEQTLRDIGAPAGVHGRDAGTELWRLERHPW
jgi:hypothetical protein